MSRSEWAFFMVLHNTDLWSIIKKFMYVGQHKSTIYNYRNGDTAAHYGHLEIVKWLYYNRTEGCTTFAMRSAAENGHLEIVKWLYYNRIVECTMYTMNSAAENGHLEMVKWLHKNLKKYTSTAIYYAAGNGHLETVKYLYQNGPEIDINTAIRYALIYGHLEVIEWLREARIKKWK
jgi:hypothetical protein